MDGRPVKRSLSLVKRHIYSPFWFKNSFLHALTIRIVIFFILIKRIHTWFIFKMCIFYCTWLKLATLCNCSCQHIVILDNVSFLRIALENYAMLKSSHVTRNLFSLQRCELEDDTWHDSHFNRGVRATWRRKLRKSMRRASRIWPWTASLW